MPIVFKPPPLCRAERKNGSRTHSTDPRRTPGSAPPSHRHSGNTQHENTETQKSAPLSGDHSATASHKWKRTLNPLHPTWDYTWNKKCCHLETNYGRAQNFFFRPQIDWKFLTQIAWIFILLSTHSNVIAMHDAIEWWMRVVNAEIYDQNIVGSFIIFISWYEGWSIGCMLIYMKHISTGHKMFYVSQCMGLMDECVTMHGQLAETIDWVNTGNGATSMV